jgi:hypothetical protein
MVGDGVALVMHTIGIYGAINYKKWAVLVSAVGYVSAMSANNLGLVWVILFLYPHVVLITEIHNEVMTPYNYERIKAK